MATLAHAISQRPEARPTKRPLDRRTSITFGRDAFQPGSTPKNQRRRKCRDRRECENVGVERYGARARQAVWRHLDQRVDAELASSNPAPPPIAASTMLSTITVVAAFAAWIPARRAAALNPNVALRDE